MHKRNLYIKKIAPFVNKPIIKVITGMRRVGKSYLLKLIIESLSARGSNPPNNILYINKESLDYDFIKDFKDLYNYVNKSFQTVQGPKYLFVDEIQEIHSWEKAITSFFSEGNIDIFITGSNAHLLSSEITTLISGRFIEFPVYTLSFKEYLLFRDNKRGDINSEFSTYLKFGGLPAIHHFDFDEEVVYQYISSIYNTILLKDVIKRNSVRNVQLLENITRYVFDNIGNIFSAKKVSNYVKSQHMSVGMETVQNYISYLIATFALHKVSRYDIKGKRLLEFHEKYYLGDIGMRHALFGYKDSVISGILENIVYLELLRRGYKVYVGKSGSREVDFIAEKEDRRIYLQVTYMLSSPETIEREFSALKGINDNYPKFVVSMDTIFGSDYEGIRRINIIDFLLKNEI